MDVDVEGDNFGQAGKVSRKAREDKEKAARHLAGNAARELYLECLQLVLRRQVWWLVREQRLPPELETVVRDLWDLRIRNFAGLKRAPRGAADDTEPESAPDSGTDGELFSSQAGNESDTSTATTRTTASRAKSWASEPGQDWNMPGLFHCLAFCYLGCLSLSLPVRVGHIYNWAKREQLPFLGARVGMPEEMLDRLPGPYHRALTVQHSSFQGGELHQAVLDLVLEYHLNYKMVFPELNAPLVLLEYLRELALPGESQGLRVPRNLANLFAAEIYVHVRAMTRLLQFTFAFNMEKKRFKILDHPDVLLVACIVVSTKLIYPLDGEDRVPVSCRDPSSLRMDWDKWRELMRDPDSEGLERRDMYKVQPEDAWSMTDRKIDDYLDWFEQTQLQPNKESQQELKEFFPVRERSQRASRHSLTEEEIDERLKTAQSYITSVAPSAHGWLLRAGEDHAVYRSAEELSGAAKAFYGKAADLAGLSLAKLLKAVSSLERSIHRWTLEEKKKVTHSVEEVDAAE